jgi:hypothetical protein
MNADDGLALRGHLTQGDLLRRSALVLAILISGGNLLIPRVPVLVVMAALALLAIATTRTAAVRPRFTLVYALLATVLLSILFRAGLTELQATIVRYANFAGGLLLLHMYLRAGQAHFIRDLTVILQPLAILAIATVILATLIEPAFQPKDVQETIYYHLFYLLNFHRTLEDAGGLQRPNGPFYEPGVLQIYLNLFLYLSLYVAKSTRKALLAGVAVLATQSTTGLAISAGLVGLHIWRQLGRGSLNRRVGVAMVAGLLAISVSGYIIDNVRSKFVGDMAGSSMARQFDLLTGLNVIAANPWVGIGFDPDRYRALSGALAFDDTLLDDRITEDRGNTNGVIALVYSVGIPLALPFLWGLFRQRMLPDRMLVGGLLFVSFMTESIMLTPFFLVFIFSGLLLAPKAITPRKPALQPATA